jgi:threonine/homoserine/homoserine lactone efflux protein
MTFESAITFFLAIFIFGITPGPGVFAILARAMTKGAPSCFSLALGMTVSDIVYLVLACLGLAVIAENYATLFTLIRWVGAAYLIYLGYKMWTAPIQTEEEPGVDKKRGLGGFVQGFLISASNPKVILFYIAFLPTFMDLTALTHQDIALAAVLTLFALMIGLMMLAYMAAYARKALKTERGIKTLNRSAGSIMMMAGIYLVSRS